MVRLEDDLYHALFNAAHDNRTSMNTYIADAISRRLEPVQVTEPPARRRCPEREGGGVQCTFFEGHVGNHMAEWQVSQQRVIGYRALE